MRYYHNSRGERCLTFLVVSILISTLLFGCKAQPRYPSGVNAAPSSPPDISLSAGDEVEIKFFYTPQLNEIQTVRPDGKITLQLVGDVVAQGKAPAELRQKLLTLYSSHVKENLEVAVIVRSFLNRRVFVGGQVMTPSVIDIGGRLTALEAIMQAGGFDMRGAELRNIIVIRHKAGQRYGYSLNLKPMLKGGEIKPFFLQPQDIVYVPRTEIVKAGQWVDQNINQIIPRTGFFFYGSTNLGGTRVGIDTSGRGYNYAR